jgi:transposase InsO family protein
VAENRLDRQFDVAAPNMAWGSDITYLYSRRVVGGALAEHMRLVLVTDALTMALWRRRPPPGTAAPSRARQPVCLRSLPAHARAVRHDPFDEPKGNCWDNSPVEQFFGSLKRECTDLKQYATRRQAKADVID